MDIMHRYLKDVLIVGIPENEGRLINDDLDDFIKELLKLYNGKRKEVALDLSKKTYLNSTGLGELIKVKDRLMDGNVGLALINPTPRVQSLLDMVGVNQFFHIIGSEDELE